MYYFIMHFICPYKGSISLILLIHYYIFLSLYLFYIYLFYSNKNLEDHLQHQHLLFQENIQVESIQQEISRYIRLSRW